jgi:hypothetical protein
MHSSSEVMSLGYYLTGTEQTFAEQRDEKDVRVGLEVGARDRLDTGTAIVSIQEGLANTAERRGSGDLGDSRRPPVRDLRSCSRVYSSAVGTWVACAGPPAAVSV